MVIFVVLAVLGIAVKFNHQQKETYRNQEVNAVKQEDSPDFPFGDQADSQRVCGEHPKEYFI